MYLGTNMLILSESAAKVILNIMRNNDLDPQRDVFQIDSYEEGYSITFARDLAPTDIVHGLRVYYRGDRLSVDVCIGDTKGLIFTKG
jgi:hypothetical protein